ncbi:MAG: radical SAM protein [Spirochaetales bacterium]|nr:radical SAM protein [Spirochaetales bacterium]
MESLMHYLESCTVCPNFCTVNRLQGEKGKCETGAGIVVAAANLHFGEERVLVGTGGSGTIFFSGCNLTCQFCQNADISQGGYGREISQSELIRVMFQLKDRGAVNINLVTPTHQGPQIMEAVRMAKKEGLGLPVVYNCGGYENPGFIKELDGLVDIYMPDFKYGCNEPGERYSLVKKYTEYCEASLIEMQRQVGTLTLDSRNIARRGLLVRHLVLPDSTACSKEVIDFLVEKISPSTYINIMGQYRPEYKASHFPELRRRPFRYEIEEVVMYARKKGMTRVLG